MRRLTSGTKKGNSTFLLLLRSFFIGFFLIVVFYGELYAQSSDNSRTLSSQQFIELVRQYHPVAKQAGLLVDRAYAELLSARGAFDPQLYFINDQKTFDGTNYYNYNLTQLKVPTWFGVELMAGVESNVGDLTSREVSIGNSTFAGLSIPLAKNLVIDQRRAVLEQSKIFVELSRQDQRNFINDLLFDGLVIYWEWVNSYQRYLILTDAVTNNRARFELIKITVEQGDRAGIDSTEALTQLLDFQYLQSEAYLQFMNTGFQLSTYLWSENSQPIRLSEDIIPFLLPENSDPFAQPVKPLYELLSAAADNHPKLMMIDNKLGILEVERRLKFQSLLPTLNLKYNALAKDYAFVNGWNSTLMENNYKFGAEIGMPLFLRQGRGDYRGAKLKIQSTQLELANTQLDIENKVKSYYNELVTLLQQIRLNERALDAYQKVFAVEEQKFALGESTLFLINNRELKVIEARQKLAELKAKFFKTGYGVDWAAGLLQ